jgi:hypothetical protein
MATTRKATPDAATAALLDARLTKLKTLAAEKAKAAKKAGKAAPKPVQQLALPLWPEEVRGVPNAVLRGALFTVSKERTTHKQITAVAAVEGIEISVKGERLNQQDLDLFEMLIHLQREQPLGDKVEFTAHAMLKTLGRPTGGSAHQRLANDIARLGSSWVEIKWTAERKAFGGTLVASAWRDDESERHVVRFNNDTMALYGQGHTWIDWGERQSLGQNNLAKWLHGFYAGHAMPYPYKVETLRVLCGSAAVLREFRRLLRRALDELVAIDALKRWKIDETDLVTVQRKPTPTQRKHLAKAKVIHKKG